jgi:hypothetical protein
VVVQIMPRAMKFSGGCAFHAYSDLSPLARCHTCLKRSGWGKYVAATVSMTRRRFLRRVAQSTTSRVLIALAALDDCGLRNPWHT